jgi:hypothetical protein
MERIMRTNTVTGVIFGVLLMVLAIPSQAQNIPNAESCPTWDCEIENQLCLKADGANYSGDYRCTNKKWVLISNDDKEIPNAESCPTWDCEIENQLCLKADGANYSGDYRCTNKKWVKLDDETIGGDGGVTASRNEDNQEELNRLRNELEQLRAESFEAECNEQVRTGLWKTNNHKALCDEAILDNKITIVGGHKYLNTLLRIRSQETEPRIRFNGEATPKSADENESTGHEEIGVRSELEDKRRLNDETYRLRAESFEAECNEQVKTGLWKTNNHKALCDEAILDNKITIEKGHWPDKYLNDLQQQLQQEAEPNIRLNVVEKRVHIKSEAEKLEELYESKCFTSLNSKFGNCKEQYCAKVAHPTCTDDQNARRLSGKLESGACRCGQHRVGNASGVGYSMPCIPSPECGF